MAEGSEASSTDVKVDQSEKVYGGEKEYLIDADLELVKKEGCNEDDEAAFDEEFITEKELIDVKESSRMLKPVVELTENSGSSYLGTANSVPNINLLMEAKIKELELQFEAVNGKLKLSESEKASMKFEVDRANEELEKMSRHCEELKLEQKIVKDHILEILQKHSLHLETLQEASTDKDMKHKGLLDMKEAFTSLSAELKMSKEKIKELEAELVSSAGKVHSLEDLNKSSSSQAELQTKRALQFENMLELAQMKANEMEDQLRKLQNELNGVYIKIADNTKIEAALETASLELSGSQEKLKISKSQVAELEHTVVSMDSVIIKLTEELNHHKASEEKIKTEVYALENLLSASKEDLKAKLLCLEEVQRKLQEQINERDIIEASLRNQAIQTTDLENNLSNSIKEKETLRSTVSDLNTKLSMNEKSCIQLEAKLQLADQNFSKTESLLSEALSYKEELEQKLKSIEQLHHESRIALESATNRNLELESSVEALNLGEESIRAQLKESEMRLASTGTRNMELEEELKLANVERLDAERKKKELKDKVAEISDSLRDVDNESSLLKCRFQGYENRVGQLESSLSKSFSRNSELEKQLNDLVSKCCEHEERANATHQRSLELEDLIHASHSEAEARAVKRVGELEQLLEAANVQTEHLEQLLSYAEVKHRDAEAESTQSNGKISELTVELEACQTKVASHDVLLQASKEEELTEIINVDDKEKGKLEDLSVIQEKDLLESKNMVQSLQSEVKSSKVRVEHVEDNLETSSVQEKGLHEKLQNAGEQWKQHVKGVEEVNARIPDLKVLHESSVKESELELQETEENFKQKLYEVEELRGKSKSVEEHSARFKALAVEATEKLASLKAEMERNAVKLVTLENNVEEPEQKAPDAYLKSEQTFLEKDMLPETTSKLKEDLETPRLKVNELNALLSSIQAEKAGTSEQLASLVETIKKLTGEHSRMLELHSTTESHLKETELQLLVVIEKLKERDSETTDLKKKLLAVESQLRAYEEQASESAVVAASQKGKLEEALLKLQNLGRLVDQLRGESEQLKTENEDLDRRNLSLASDLSTHVTKISEMQIALNAATAERDETSMQLHSSREEMENLMRQVNTDRESLQSQIKNMRSACALREAAITAKLKEHLNILEEREDLDGQLKQIQSELVLAHEAIIEQRELDHRRELEREASMKQSFTELEDKHHYVTLLEKHIEDLERKLEDAETQHNKATEEKKKIVELNGEISILRHKLSQTDEMEKKISELENKLKLAYTTSGEEATDEVIESETKDEMGVKSRDSELDTSTLSRRKNTKRRDFLHQAPGTASLTQTSHVVTGPSRAMSFKIIMGVAIMSLIIGVILGKRY
ncbi:unnamed protein product [Musa acuminata subsp. malaccensis]|uniref:(wild Malaysian banana) hypothetical protein n=1 Tax=Musa acuminata subsp. malaccensis TaxID=214687 RepID=A0A804J9T0_MUSAM|nr:PREDICTED: centromere protein F-like [Musa acuminata subsp. malaccensis]XP_018681208.1 PREDICTED: centromere protein F-like [Musa acuminata subsp. malaccensis]XP_018681209.1 PREDICTED: centromere protein F-like [Musa acuminata subsp. malaccensis]XP_018681210.1 PREDICTED: centromere protein F-like [Musa acuminata subsp. malaccensis]XP_018681212.1 PREDICTED: centromere protein F-like [Musa acuminata subsp. malaccensis]XP_018681213.1 PREDICTED: centromere protein F-like [Musa acuminata subsp. 